MAAQGARDPGTEKVRAITGLIAVVVGIAAVVGVAVVAVILLGDKNQEAVVAIATSALGIISASITAYLGIKATANTSKEATAAVSEKSGEAAVAQHETAVAEREVVVKKSKVDRLNKEIEAREKTGQIRPEVADELRHASVEAEEEAREVGPTGGGG